MAATTHAERLEAGRRIFTRIVVGVDGSDRALEAARQAALLEDVRGQLTLVTVWDTASTIIGGTGTQIPSYYDEELQRSRAEQALAVAQEYIAPYTAATSKLVRGAPTHVLLEEIDREEDTLVAVGCRNLRRLRAVVEGSVATEMVHRAPCSVLVARSARDGFPSRIVVGVDGSVESAAAYAGARYLAERFDAELHALVAWGGKGANEHLVAAITDSAHEDSRRAAADALADAARDADLVVVGSRGLHGLRALGSVSERLAHTAACSALIVRLPIWQRISEELGR